MKRISISYILLAALMILASCSKDEIIKEKQKDTALKEDEIYIDVPLPKFKNYSQDNSRVSYDDKNRIFKWETGDVLLICSDKKPDGETFTFVKDEGNKARFKGKIPPTGEDTNLYCYYKAAKLNVKENYKAGTIDYPKNGEPMGTVNFANPTAHLKEHLLLRAIVATESFKEKGVTLSLKNAIMRFDIKEIKRWNREDGYNKVTWTANGKSKLTLSLLEADETTIPPLYFCFDPSAMKLEKANTVSLTFEGKQGVVPARVTGLSSEGKNYMVNTIYNIKVASSGSVDTSNTLCKWAGRQLGDVMMADGSFMTPEEIRVSENEVKNNAKGIVAFLYTKDTETQGVKNFLEERKVEQPHGLVLSLKNGLDSKDVEWGNSTKIGNIMSPTIRFACEGADDGCRFIEKMKNFHVPEFPALEAIFIMKEIPSGKTTRWYVPSIKEWIYILGGTGIGGCKEIDDIMECDSEYISYRNVAGQIVKNLNTCFDKLNLRENLIHKFGTPGEDYWSVSEFDENHVYCITLFESEFRISNDFKNRRERVRAILAF